MPDQLLTIKQVAEIVQIDRKQIARWIHSGELRGVPVNRNPNAARRHYRVRESDLDAFLTRRAGQAEERPQRRRRRKAKPDVTNFY